MDLFRHLADQLVDIQSREHRVGDRHRDAKVVALVAQQIVIDVIADPVLNLFGDDGDDLREGMQPLELFRSTAGCHGGGIRNRRRSARPPPAAAANSIRTGDRARCG